jgi:hypothetical protein
MRKAVETGRERAEAARERASAARETGRERVEAAREAGLERVEAAREAAKSAAEEFQARVKPRLRGVIHEYAFPVSLLAGMLLVLFVGQTVAGKISLGRCSAPALSITASTGSGPAPAAGCGASTIR